MDDMTAFERLVAGRIQHHVGPIRPVDDLAVFEAVIAATHSPRWGFTMFSALKFIAASAIVALFGGFLLAGVLTTPQEGEVPPAAGTESPSPDLMAATEANETAYLDAFFVAQDLDAIMATFAEDAIFEDQMSGDYLEGNAAVRGTMADVLRRTDWDATEVLDRFVSADGSRAVIVERWVGTNYLGAPFDLPIVLIKEYRDGKIAKESVYYAARDVYEQLTRSPSAE